ncbi:MAG TPA: GNAT family N-acetyltransferase [Acidimicrobiales bacterium]|nr:GNAT family N-acetyltransferase [Acidimicrobiales bacterium]
MRVEAARDLALPLSTKLGAVSLAVREEPIDNLHLHAEVPIAFLVERILEPTILADGLGGIALREVEVEAPWWKDYDAAKGEGPTRWAKRFDVSNWGLMAAYQGTVRIGGAVVALKAPGLEMIDGRGDLAVLWDLRVRPESRSHGAGYALFRAAEEWARKRGCRTLKVETQNINVAACRFYARMGCTLTAINLDAYPEFPHEVQLLWQQSL